MKFKRNNKSGGLLVELSPKDVQLPSTERTGALPVFQLKKILVPVDFSECSEKALQYAVPFAQQFGAEIILLSVIHYPIEFPEALTTEGQTVREADAELRALAKDLGAGVPCETLVKIGAPDVEILEAARASDADLVILSTHGRSGLAHALLGSTAERVVRYASCPVLVVREHEHEFIAGTEQNLPEKKRPKTGSQTLRCQR